MTKNDPEFLDWLREQDDDALGADIVTYGTPTMTATLTKTHDVISPFTGRKIAGSVTVSAYPEIKLVVVTYHGIVLDGPTKSYSPGVIQEVPVRSATPVDPSPVVAVFRRERAALVRDGWTVTSGGEQALSGE